MPIVLPVVTVALKIFNYMYPNTIHNNTAGYLRLFWVHLRLSIKLYHFQLLRMLLDRKTSIAIVRSLLFWYSKQSVMLNWKLVCLTTFVYQTDKAELSPQSYSLFMLTIFQINELTVKLHVNNDVI